jgi:glutathione peroxidase
MPRHRLFLALAATSLLFANAQVTEAESNMSRVSAHAFAFKSLDGNDIRLAAYAGKPILIVNTASLCGYTPQYAGLQELWTRYGERGLLILGVPSNDFGGQEPGGAAEIEHTAHGQYGVSFPLTEKVEVKGSGAHPFYRWAGLERPIDTPRWNFHKYLIGRDGRITASFPSAVAPDDPRIVAAIEKELAE